MSARSRWAMAGAVLILTARGVEVSVADPGFPSGLDAIGTPQPGAPSVRTSLAVQNTCDFTVTYTWSGLKGRNLIASVGVFFRGNGGLDVGIANFNFEGQAGSAGSVSHTFTLKANASAPRSLLGRGDLADSRKYQRVDGSASSSTLITSTCG